MTINVNGEQIETNENGYLVNQVVIVANDFSEDFIGECEYDLDLSISLITSEDLIKIYEEEQSAF